MKLTIFPTNRICWTRFTCSEQYGILSATIIVFIVFCSILFPYGTAVRNIYWMNLWRDATFQPIVAAFVSLSYTPCDVPQVIKLQMRLRLNLFVTFQSTLRWFQYYCSVLLLLKYASKCLDYFLTYRYILYFPHTRT